MVNQQLLLVAILFIIFVCFVEVLEMIDEVYINELRNNIESFYNREKYELTKQMWMRFLEHIYNFHNQLLSCQDKRCEELFWNMYYKYVKKEDIWMKKII